MFSGSYEGDQLRTRIVFFSASAIFAFGLWAYLFGATSPLGKTTDVQFDGLSLVPGIIAVCGMVMLNTLVDRSVLTSEGMEMFSNALPARFCVFVIAIVNLCAVAIAIVRFLLCAPSAPPRPCTF